MHARNKMTGQQGNRTQFNTRADSAAQALRGNLRSKGADIPESGSVEVGPDGKPPAPPPPEGSYARMAMDQAAATAHRDMGQPSPREQLGDQPPAGTAEQSVDGSMAPPLAQPGQAPLDTQAEALTPNAQRRIQELATKLREKDQKLQLLEQEANQGRQSAAEMKSQLESLSAQYQQLIDNNLDHLDPESRAQVMADARMREMLAQVESRILQRLEPTISGIAENQRTDEMMRLSNKYPAFDVQIHGHLIEAVRAKNPNLSVEQAFLAATVDTPEERMTREAAAAYAVPPMLPPGNGAKPRYIAEPASPQPTIEDEIRGDAERIKELMRSSDPNDHKAGQNLVLKNLSDRLSR